MSKKRKIGILGGSFDPPHNGHLQTLLLCLSKLKLDWIYIIPSYQTPGKAFSKTSPESRLAMAKQGFDLPNVEVLDIEIKKLSTSYTIDTLEELSLSDEVFLIIGSDLLAGMIKWKRFEKIIEKVNVAVINRSGSLLSDFKQEHLPLFKKYIQKNLKSCWKMKTGNEFIFIDSDKYIKLSSSILKNKIKLNISTKKYIPAQLNIDKHYQYLTPVDEKVMNEGIIKFLKEERAIRPEIFSFNEAVYEHIIITSALNTRHVKAICKLLIEYIKNSYDIEPSIIEGGDLGQWVVLDYDFLIIHIFYDYLRDHYKLEELWSTRKIEKK